MEPGSSGRVASAAEPSLQPRNSLILTIQPRTTIISVFYERKNVI